MKNQVILLLGVCAAVALGGKGGGDDYGGGGYGGGYNDYGGYEETGGKGKGKGQVDDYSHLDFGPARYVYQPVTHYREREVQRPVTVYQPHIVKEPYVRYRKVLQPPAPKLIKKPVVTHVQEWKLVPVPKVTYQDVWVHPYYEEEKTKEKGCWFCGKGKGTKKEEEEVVIIDGGYGHPQPHHPPQPAYGAPAPAYHPPQPTYGPPPKGHH